MVNNTQKQASTPIDSPWWPNHLVLGWFDDQRTAQQAVERIRRDAPALQDAFVLPGPEAAERLAGAQFHRNVFKRMARVIWATTFIDARRLSDFADCSRQGGYVVVVQTRNDASADETAHQLAHMDGHEVTRFSHSEGIQVMGPRS